MLTKFWQYLDESGWPARLVKSLVSRRRFRLSNYFLNSSATNAVRLSVASSSLATRDLIAYVLPQGFGSWRDFQVRATLVDGPVAVAILKDLRSGERFSMTVPVHAGFSPTEFSTLKTVRITCEAERAALLTLRHLDGRLIAAGTLELVPRAAFSHEVLV
jgi:hypothetical protein